jgi:hypothetical protein
MAMYSFPKNPIVHNGSEGSIVRSLPELELAHDLDLMNGNDMAAVEPTMSRSKCRAYAFALCAILRHLGPWQNAEMYASRLDRVLETIESIPT